MTLLQMYGLSDAIALDDLALYLQCLKACFYFLAGSIVQGGSRCDPSRSFSFEAEGERTASQEEAVRTV